MLEIYSLGVKVEKSSISVWNKEELPDQWKESIIVLVHKKDDN
jgi:hypothetical protein